MGGLPSVALLGVLYLGCDEKKDAPIAPKARAAAVEATARPTAEPVAPAAPSEAPAEPRRTLCAGELEAKGRDLPDKATLSRAGTPKPPEHLPVGSGRWTWINFWAAWCVPCKEEIPRLRAWEQKLASRLRVVFVSLDDDARQLEGFVDKQPADGLKSTYWLRDGKERQEWLSEAAIESDPELPMHLLVDPKGKVRCTINGAVEDEDFDRVSEIVGS